MIPAPFTVRGAAGLVLEADSRVEVGPAKDVDLFILVRDHRVEIRSSPGTGRVRTELDAPAEDS